MIESPFFKDEDHFLMILEKSITMTLRQIRCKEESMILGCFVDDQVMFGVWSELPLISCLGFADIGLGGLNLHWGN